MKSAILFVGVSLILVVGVVAVAIPNAAEAAPKHQWCYTAASVHCGASGFDNKGDCKKAEKEDGTLIVEPCHKVPVA